MSQYKRHAQEVISGKLSADELFGKSTALIADQVPYLLNLCLSTTYFLFQGEYNQQKGGATMGSPVSSVVANIYMEIFKDLELRRKQTPRIGKDTVIKGGRRDFIVGAKDAWE